jgi:hypothetical protein
MAFYSRNNIAAVRMSHDVIGNTYGLGELKPVVIRAELPLGRGGSVAQDVRPMIKPLRL